MVSRHAPDISKRSYCYKIGVVFVPPSRPAHRCSLGLAAPSLLEVRHHVPCRRALNLALDVVPWLPWPCA